MLTYAKTPRRQVTVYGVARMWKKAAAGAMQIVETSGNELKTKRTNGEKLMANKAGPRKAAYDKAYNARPEQVQKRMERNRARAALMKEGLVRKGDGKDVDHKVPLDRGGTNARSNLRVVSKSKNRGWRKGKSGYDA